MPSFSRTAITVEFQMRPRCRVCGNLRPRRRTADVVIEVSTVALWGHAWRATGEIGPILIRKLEKVRQTVRVEFLWGVARKRSRADYEALSKVAQLFSASLEDAPRW